MKLPKLHYFDRSEFVRDEDWFTKMSPRLLILLDTFRHLTGPCIISPNDDAIGRRTEPIDGYYDAHNYVKWGEVKGIDVFPTLEPKGLTDQFPLEGDDDYYFMDAVVEEWVYQAEKINFGAIGIYPDWTLNGKKRPGAHLDVRDGWTTWGRIGNDYVSLDKAMEVLA
ncbi:hypothetical protein [Gracilimonas sp.]|uniref:hypothetical protein n=1 Tax=Gracilimonas sp. TaxID=1974203 RepID=UPI0028723FE7|nr:hypothetical protein [Gracilimonas sp.]